MLPVQLIMILILLAAYQVTISQKPDDNTEKPPPETTPSPNTPGSSRAPVTQTPGGFPIPPDESRTPDDGMKSPTVGDPIGNSSDEKKKAVIMMVAGLVGVIVGVTIIALAVWFCCRKKKGPPKGRRYPGRKRTVEVRPPSRLASLEPSYRTPEEE